MVLDVQVVINLTGKSDSVDDVWRCYLLWRKINMMKLLPHVPVLQWVSEL